MYKSITGTVTGVRGDGFDLLDDARNRLPFMLEMDVSLEAGDLRELERDGTRVTVEYDDDTPTARLAHRVFAAPPRQ